MNRFISLRWGAGVLSLVLGAAACGKIPDPPEGPKVGKATLVAVHDDESPVVGATVVHTTVDGTLIGQAVTSGTGSAVFDITEGDILSIGWLEPDANGGSSKRLFTILDVEVDDKINVNNRRSFSSDVVSTVVVQTQALPVGADHGDLLMGNCSANVSPTSMTAMITIRRNCLDAAGKFTLVGRALNTNGQMLGASVLVDQAPPPAGQVITMPQWRTPTTPKVSFSIVNVPDGATRTQGTLDTYRHGLPYETYPFSGDAQSPGAVMVPTAPAYVEAIAHSALASFPSASDPTKTDGVVFMLAKEAYANDVGAAYTADLSLAMPRVFESTYAAATQTFEWKIQAADDEQAGRLSGGDIVAIALPWGEPNDPNNQKNVWVVVAPGFVGSPLKVDVHQLASFAPPADSGILPVSFRALEIDIVEGYHDMKTRFGTNFLESVDQLDNFEGLASFSGELH